MKHTVAPRVSALLALLAAAGTAAAQFTGFATPPDNYPLNDRGRDAAIADFNLDGFLDIAVCDEDGSPATPSTVTVYLNDGDGTFTPGVPVPVGAGASGIVSGHFNADTRPDLAVACSQAGELYVLINNGAGAFIASAPYPISGSPIDVAAGQVT
ncbi:MAG: FG-GAP repeat domain-containing protein, partial [Phycisphaerales bacterium JB040]